MAFWDKFKKRKTQPSGTEESSSGSESAALYDLPAGIPNDNGGSNIPHSNNDGFIYPPPHDVQAGGWIQTYPLVFFLMENNVCTRKIEYTCYGYDCPDDILKRMTNDGLIPQLAGFAYRILYWPTENGMGTVEHFDDSAPKSLQDFNPEAGKIFIIEQYRENTEPMEMYTIYGCPTAALPEQKNVLQNPCIDIVVIN